MDLLQVHRFGDPMADKILVQMTESRELRSLESEESQIRLRYKGDFCLMALQVNDWNAELSPWKAASVGGTEEFAGSGPDTLKSVLELCSDQSKTYYIGGYSLSGLFALWAAYQTDIFKGVAAASPSVWYPGFVDYMKGNQIYCNTVYLSLGDKEEKTRNTVMATVADRIREAYDLLGSQGVQCTLEWNKGSHFQEADKRTSKAFAWVLNK